MGGIEAVDTRGHTAGQVSLFLPTERILIAGDAINNVEGLGGSREQFTANADDARAAVSTLAALLPDSIVFGHGPSIVGAAAEQLEELIAAPSMARVVCVSDRTEWACERS